MDHAEAISSIEASIAALYSEGRSLELEQVADQLDSLVSAARYVKNATVLEAKGDFDAANHQMRLAMAVFDYAEKRTSVIYPESQ
jgi:hypothetical protein